MKEITHRQMRNDSADVLRRVAAGGTILVTNSGQPAAVIGPPISDTLSLLSAEGRVREAIESAALAEGLAAGRRLVASWLLHTEMHCAAGRHPHDVDLTDVQSVLNALNLVDLARGDMIAAGTHAPLRSNDALHLAVAIRLGSDEMVTYDGELAAAAKAAGFGGLRPATVTGRLSIPG